MLYLIGKLKDHGVAKVIANFDGQGDSGEVYDIEFYDIYENHIDYNTCATLEDFIYDKIEQLVGSYGGDWVNNDGGYGQLNIDVKDKIIDGHYNQRTVDGYSWDGNDIFT